MVMLCKSVRVIHGANDGTFDVAGSSVAKVRESLVDAFNLSTATVALVNGMVVPLNYRLSNNDTLEFFQRYGVKGSGKEAVAANEAYWPAHPLAELFPRMTAEERADLKKDIKERVERGLDPLEHPIILYGLQIIDGRHRAEVWKELADEGACNGFFRTKKPPTQSMKEGQGVVEAWMRAKSANMIHRQMLADQKAAVFLRAVDEIPELKAVIETIKDANEQRKKEGKRLGADDQRVSTNKAIADSAGVGETTVKGVKNVKENAPEKFEEIVQGKKTVKQAKQEIKDEKKQEFLAKNGLEQKDEVQVAGCSVKDTATEPIKVGDVLYTFDLTKPSIFRFTVSCINLDEYLSESDQSFSLDLTFYRTQKDAEAAWKSQLKEKIAELKKQLQDGPEICDCDSGA